MPYIISKSDFYLDHVNDKSFNTNPSDTNSHVLGSVMNKVKACFEIDLYWETLSTVSLMLTVNVVGGNTIIMRNYGSFLDDEFCIGDTICFETNLGTTIAYTIQSLSASTMLISGTTTVPNATYDDSPFLKIKGVSKMNGLVYKFGLVENGNPPNYDWIDGKEQAYQSATIPTATTQMNKVGSICSWQTGESTVEYLGIIDPAGKGTLQRYRICHEFIITPFYQDGEKSNIQNNIAPALFNGTSSLNYVFQAEFRNNLSNPNCSKLVQEITPLGNVKWFNQALNGVNEYIVKNVVYEDSNTDPVNCLIAGEDTTVCITVESPNGLFNPTDKVGLYLSLLPSSSDYSCTTTSFFDNWCFDCVIEPLGTTTPTPNPVIKDIEFTYSSANLIEICATLNFPKSVTNLDCYLIGVDVSDNLPSQQTNKTMLVGDVKNFEYDACVPDLLQSKGIEFYDHVTDLGSPNFTTDYKGHVEDGVLMCYNFCLDLSKNAYLKSLDIKLVGYNPTTGDKFTIESYPVSLASEVLVPSGSYTTQQITLNSQQGFNTIAGSQYNVNNFNTGALVGSLQEYNGCIGIKFCWQDNEPLTGVPGVFYDSSKPHNGFNKNVSNYNGLNGYFLRMVVCAVVSDGNIDTPYEVMSPNLDICDYNAESDWSYNIVTTDKDNFDTQCNVLEGEDTNVKVTATYTGATPPQLNELYAILRIEPKGIGTKGVIEENSTYRTNLLDYFKSDMTITKMGSVYCLETVINGDKVAKPNEYKLSFKIGCPSGEPCELPLLSGGYDLGSDMTGTPTTIFINYANPDGLPMCLTLKSKPNTIEYSSLFNIGDNPKTATGTNKPANDTWNNLQPCILPTTSNINTGGQIVLSIPDLAIKGFVYTDLLFCMEVENSCGTKTVTLDLGSF